MPIVAGEKMLSPEEKAHLHSLWFVKKEHRGKTGGLDMSALSKLSKPEKAYVIEEYKNEAALVAIRSIIKGKPDVVNSETAGHILMIWDMSEKQQAPVKILQGKSIRISDYHSSSEEHIYVMGHQLVFHLTYRYAEISKVKEYLDSAVANLTEIIDKRGYYKDKLQIINIPKYWKDKINKKEGAAESNVKKVIEDFISYLESNDKGRTADDFFYYLNQGLTRKYNILDKAMSYYLAPHKRVPFETAKIYAEVRDMLEKHAKSNDDHIMVSYVQKLLGKSQ